MPIIEYDSYKQKLGTIGPRLEKLAAALDLEGARREVDELEEKTGDPNFWNRLPEGPPAHQTAEEQAGEPRPPHLPVGGPDHPGRDGHGGGRCLPPVRGPGGL